MAQSFLSVSVKTFLVVELLLDDAVFLVSHETGVQPDS